MPSIKQADLDTLHQDVADAQASSQRHLEEYQSLKVAYDQEYGKRQDFDKVLDQIIKTASGDYRWSGDSYGNIGMTPMMGGQMRELTKAERHEALLTSLNERVVNLESRLAAAVAVATFAKKDHGEGRRY